VVSSLSSGTVLASVRPDKLRYPPPGVAGGKPGRLGKVFVNDVDMDPGQSVLTMQRGDRILMELPGGGGFGFPWERDPQAVATDVEAGFVSSAEARSEYGVVIGNAGIDEQATAALRAELAASHEAEQATTTGEADNATN
jgi:N-methylhydantoinase B